MTRARLRAFKCRQGVHRPVQTIPPVCKDCGVLMDWWWAAPDEPMTVGWSLPLNKLDVIPLQYSDALH